MNQNDDDDPFEELKRLIEELTTGDLDPENLDGLDDLQGDDDQSDSPFDGPMGPLGPDIDDLPFGDLEDIAGGQFGGNEVAIDLRETDESFFVTADLAGFEKDNIDLTLSDHKLHLSASRDVETEEKDGSFIKRERFTESASRVIELPDEVDGEEVEATFENGVLSVELPKENPDEGHEITIE